MGPAGWPSLGRLEPAPRAGKSEGPAPTPSRQFSRFWPRFPFRYTPRPPPTHAHFSFDLHKYDVEIERGCGPQSGERSGASLTHHPALPPATDPGLQREPFSFRPCLRNRPLAAAKRHQVKKAQLCLSSYAPPRRASQISVALNAYVCLLARHHAVPE